jgi:hypothetical protein
MYKVIGAENCSCGDTQQPAAAAANQNPSSKNLVSSFSKSFICSVNKEEEQQFSRRGITL